MKLKCNRCDSTESRLVEDYETGETERLCWNHRMDIILERTRQGGNTKSPKNEEPEDKLTGQTGITDF